MRGLERLARIVSTLACTALLAASPPPPAQPQKAPAPHFVVTSDDFTDDDQLKSAFVYNQNGCTGDNKAPQLSWTGAPPKTKSYAIVVSDPDAYPGTFYHWIRINIPKSVSALPPADPNQTTGLGLDMRNSFGTSGYAGPCPPKKEAPHHYAFTVYALSVDRLPKINPNSSPKAIFAAMRGKVLAQAAISGRFGR